MGLINYERGPCKMIPRPSQKIVTVCDKCLTETCFKGYFRCVEAEAGEAGSLTDTEDVIALLSPSPIELQAQRELGKQEAPALV